jgi:hypothetical protein
MSVKMGLELATIDELVNEIENRTVCMVMAYKLKGGGKEKTEVVTRSGQGNRVFALGMVAILHDDVMNGWDDDDDECS